MARWRRLLVVEDEPMMRAAIVDMLEALEGFDVLEASDGAEALRIIDLKKPDLVLLDLLMPGVSGFDVLEALHAQGRSEPAPKVIVVSALIAPALADHLRQLGAARVLTKPFHVEDLLGAVADVAGPA